MKKFLMIIMVLILTACTMGGSINAGGGSNGIGVGLGLGTAIRF